MKKTIADIVTNKIKKGEITMKSQLSVWTEKLGLNGGLIVIFGLLFAITGFVLYWTNSNSDLLLGGYVHIRLSSFIQSFPYIFVLPFLFLFIFLIIIFRRFDFSYKKPFFTILLFILAGILISGWLSIKQPIGQQLYQQEGQFFRMGMMNNSNAISGIVIEVSKNTITIQDEKNTKTIINLSANTHFPFGQPKIGDSIRAVGTWNGVIFNTLGVRVFDNTNPSTLGPGMMHGRGQGRGMMWNR